MSESVWTHGENEAIINQGEWSQVVMEGSVLIPLGPLSLP